MIQERLTRRDVLASAAAVVLPTGVWGVERTTEEVAWLNEVQRAPLKVPQIGVELKSPLVGEDGKRLATLDEWQTQRRKIRDWWIAFLQPLELPPSLPPPLTVMAEDKVDGIIRQLVRYQVETRIWTEAYLLKPAKVSRQLPAVAVFHSTVSHSIRQPAGVEGRPEKAFGLKLAQRGYVTFCPRNFLWPTNHKIAANEETRRFHDRRPNSKGMAKMLHDAQVAVDILCGLPEVDAERIGSVGHSLGAKEVLYLAALDERVKVTVSSEGGVGTGFSNWNAPWYLGSTIDDKSTFTHEHHELLALAAPRPFLLLGGDSADGARSWPFIESALPVYKLFGGKPRLGLFNHEKGHAVPPAAEKRIYEWMETYL